MGSLKLPSMIDITAHEEKWSTDPPTEDGWYWAYDSRDGKVEMIFYGNEPELVWIDRLVLELYTHWLGPLPKPEPPT